MSKRRLTRQQRQRIAAQQLRTLGGESVDASLESCDGRIVGHVGRQVQVEALGGDAAGTLLQCHQRANLPDLVTGDLVVYESAADGSGVVLARGERRNVFTRPDSRGRERPLAANIDYLLIVIAAVPQPYMNLIDRYLVAVEHLRLRPVLVLNKTDLIERTNRDELDNILSIYEDLDYPVFRVSAHDGAGMDALEAALSGQTTVLVGQSGVGKSSLINRLGGDELTVVGELSEARAKGTHTTTTARLFHLRHCDLIDSPGIREFQLAHLDAQQVLQGFPELRDLAGKCRFRNCRHQGDPGCAIAKALEAGEVHPLRWQSYCHLRATLPTPDY